MSINKIFLYTFSILFILIALAWFVLYSNFTANNLKIISIRNSFFSVLDSVTPKGLFIYKARPISYGDGKYVYKFPGKFQKIDFDNSTITLKDLHGKNWTFKYLFNRKKDGTQSNINSVDYRYVLKKKDKSTVSSISKIIISNETPSKSFSHFSVDDVIVLYWGDSRTMLDLHNFNKESTVIELKGAEQMPINKIVWE